jgi:hypothetical protein
MVKELINSTRVVTVKKIMHFFLDTRGMLKLSAFSLAFTTLYVCLNSKSFN